MKIEKKSFVEDKHTVLHLQRTGRFLKSWKIIRQTAHEKYVQTASSLSECFYHSQILLYSKVPLGATKRVWSESRVHPGRIL